MTIRCSRAAVSLILVLGSVFPVFADQTEPSDAAPAPPMTRDSEGRVTVRAVRVVEPPRIDGVLDEPIYESLEPITGFIQQDPDEGALATEATLVWILFDADNLYIGARCRDSQPHRIMANDMRRDGSNVSQNDNISVIIDTFHDGRNGYEFLMNSIGGAWDTQITDERDANRDWNTVWIPRSRREAEGSPRQERSSSTTLRLSGWTPRSPSWWPVSTTPQWDRTGGSSPTRTAPRWL